MAAKYIYFYLPRSRLNPFAPEFIPSHYRFHPELPFSPPHPPAPTYFYNTHGGLALTPTSPPSLYYRPGPEPTSPQFKLQPPPLPHDLLYSPPDLSPDPKPSRVIGNGKKARKSRGGRSSGFVFNRPPRLLRQQGGDTNHNSKTTVTIWKVKCADEIRFPDVEESDDDIGRISRVVEYKSQRRRGLKYEVQQVLEDESHTTVMIRNIPSKYTREMMLEFLDKYCLGVNKRATGRSIKCLQVSDDEERYSTAYDFFYLPMDFKTGMNKSYAFVNFSDPRSVWKFSRDCCLKDWEYFQSSKKMEIAIAKYQGRDQLIERFGKTAFACEKDEYLPVCFDPPRDGSNKGRVECTNVGRRISPKKKPTCNKYQP